MSKLIASLNRVLRFGYEGENNVTQIVFTYDESWLAYGNGEFKIRVLRNGDKEAYNATSVVDDRESMTLTMTVTDIELSKKGHGELQLVYKCADSIKKSPIYRYNVNRAIDSEIVDPPEGSIIAEVEKSLVEIKDEIGSLSELTTTDKTSLVSAINEVNAKEVEVTVDSELSAVSTNPLQNKIVTLSFMNALDRLEQDESQISDNAQNISGLQSDVGDVQTALAGKASTDTATQSANGLMSSADKTKLDAVGSVVTVSGTTPTIVALSGVRYVCGEVSTLDITPCISGICDIVFTSGNTATVLTLPSTVKFPDGTFTPEANTTYELNIMDGIYGAVMAWT